MTALALIAIGQVVPPPLPAKPIEIDAIKTTLGVRIGDVSQNQKGILLFFLTTECPIANRYAPEISRIAAEHEPKDIVSVIVYVDPNTTKSEAGRHQKDYALPKYAVLDIKHVLVDSIGISATPECALIDRSGYVVYRGRIDDTYIEHGRPRDKPQRLDLRIALKEFLSGKKISVRSTPAIGCNIPPLPPPSKRAAKSY